MLGNSPYSAIREEEIEKGIELLLENGKISIKRMEKMKRYISAIKDCYYNGMNLTDVTLEINEKREIEVPLFHFGDK